MRHDEEGVAVSVRTESPIPIPIPIPVLLPSPATHIVFITLTHGPVAAVDDEASRAQEVTANSMLIESTELKQIDR